jgi:hypothetical protein
MYYQVTLWHVSVTIAAVETQQCILCFSDHLINGTKLLNVKDVLFALEYFSF